MIAVTVVVFGCIVFTCLLLSVLVFGMINRNHFARQLTKECDLVIAGEQLRAGQAVYYRDGKMYAADLFVPSEIGWHA